MSETPVSPKVYSLRQVAVAIKSALDRATGNRLWMVRAEIVKINGTLGQQHVYLDLIDESEGVKQAAMRGVIWKTAGRQIREDLGPELPQVFRDGAEIVFHARVSFHEVFGLSLHIEKIDLSYMLGELERRKQATIKALTEAGALQLNKRLPLLRVPQRVALVGSPGTSGFRDFCTVALRNPYGLRMDLHVFEARVQGDGAPADLVHALERAQECRPDLIVLVRGGGSKIDLDCFNDLGLCRKISEMSVPVWTGIGHESDLVVADLVAHTAHKTPTDCANRWIEQCINAWAEASEMGRIIARIMEQRVRQFQQTLSDQRNRIGTTAQLQLRSQSNALNLHRERIAGAARMALAAKRGEMERRAETLAGFAQRRLHAATLVLDQARALILNEPEKLLVRRQEQLAQIQDTLTAYGPEQTLKRGFAIVRKGGKSITKAEALLPGERLTLELHAGSVEVQVVHFHEKHP